MFYIIIRYRSLNFAAALVSRDFFYKGGTVTDIRHPCASTKECYANVMSLNFLTNIFFTIRFPLRFLY